MTLELSSRRQGCNPSIAWLRRNFPKPRLCRLPRPHSLAAGMTGTRRAGDGWMDTQEGGRADAGCRGTYQGDEVLARLLAKAGSRYDLAALRALVAGVLAAPPSVAEPDGWTALVA